MSQAIAVIWSWTAGLGARQEQGLWAVPGLPWRLRPLAVSVLATALLSLYFILLPGADLAVTAGFYSPGNPFPLSELPALRLLRKSSSWLMAAILIGALAGLVAAMRRNGLAGLARARRAWCILAGLALGPGCWSI